MNKRLGAQIIHYDYYDDYCYLLFKKGIQRRCEVNNPHDSFICVTRYIWKKKAKEGEDGTVTG